MCRASGGTLSIFFYVSNPGFNRYRQMLHFARCQSESPTPGLLGAVTSDVFQKSCPLSSIHSGGPLKQLASAHCLATHSFLFAVAQQ